MGDKRYPTPPSIQAEWGRLGYLSKTADVDPFIAVEWLNAAKGTPAFQRVLEIQGELENLASLFDTIRQQRKTLKLKGLARTKQAIAEDHNTMIQIAKLQEDFRERCNALNRRFASYSFTPALAYSLDSGAWHFSTIPNHKRGLTIELNNSSVTLRVSEATVVAALARLAVNRELYKVRLCENCKENWRVSLREMDKYCSDKCREEFRQKSPEYKARKAAARRKSRRLARLR